MSKGRVELDRHLATHHADADETRFWVVLGTGRKQLRLRAARALPAAVRARRPAGRVPRPVGDRGVQAAKALSQRRPLQEDLGHLHWLQEHRLQDRQRAQAID